MRRKSGETDVAEVSKRLGDRGDLVACLTAQIGDEVQAGDDVPEDEIRELLEAMTEIRVLLDVAEEYLTEETSSTWASAD